MNKETYEPWKGVKRNQRQGWTFAFGSFKGRLYLKPFLQNSLPKEGTVLRLAYGGRTSSLPLWTLH